MMELPFETELYSDASNVWPQTGKHILATETEQSIILYQAYKTSIAKWAVENQTFVGCPDYSMERMTWVKPGFLWMMYRSGWGTKVRQESTLAIRVDKAGFMQLLKLCKKHDKDDNFAGVVQEQSGEEGVGLNDVRIQWDPDHDPFGEKVDRRAIQLGIRGQTLQKFLKEWIISISDITEFVNSQHEHLKRNDIDKLQVPIQRVFEIEDNYLKEYIERQ